MKNVNEQVFIKEPVYIFEISRCPITDKRRQIEAPELSINDTSIFLQCTVYYLNEDGSKIVSERFNSYDCRLWAENSPRGPWVNPNTKERYEIENGMVPDDAVLRYSVLRDTFNGADPIYLKPMVHQFVINADNIGEFNI